MKPPQIRAHSYAYLGLGFLTVLMAAVQCVAQISSGPSPAEEYILTSSAEGNMADLRTAFPKEEDRVLSVGFLTDLIINPGNKHAIHRNGIQIKGAVVRDFLNLSGVEVPVHIYLLESRFEAVKLFQATFKKGFQMRSCDFGGEAYFSYASFAGGLSLSGSNFSKTSEFEAMTVKGPAFFDSTVFSSRASFAYANVDGVFQMNGAAFNSKADDVVFNSMRIGSGFFLEGATFEGPVDFVNVRIGDNLQAEKSRFNNSEKVAVFNTLNAHGLFLNEAAFAGPVDFANANISGLANFENTGFKHPPVLTNFAYESLISDQPLLDFVKGSKSDYTAYVQLESFLQRYGRTGEADEAFMEKKRLERRRLSNVTAILRSYASEYLQGFGRKPGRVFMWDFAVIALGALIFSRKRMARKTGAAVADRESSETAPNFNPWAYSITLFAPTIDSKYTTNWEPAPQHTKTKHYVKIHQLLGWALVLVTVGVWTGTFK